MSGWARDFAYAGRLLVKRPGDSLLAIVALALGIGLTTTMFSIVQGVILRGLPFEGSDRIHAVTQSSLSDTSRGRSIGLHDYVDFRDQQQSFESLEAYNQAQVTLTGPGGYPEQVRAARITPGTFRALRATPALGRDFVAADAEPGASAVMIIGDTLWQTRFSSSPSAVGTVVNIDGRPTTIIGVMPEKFAFPQSQHAWLPFVVTPPATRGGGASASVLGRLRDGVTRDRANAEFEMLSSRLAQQHEANKNRRAWVDPWVETTLGRDVTGTLMTMLVAVFGVMVIACVNVTNLQLARAAERTREVAIRVAVGAGRWRIIRQTLAEGLVLSAIGAAAGLAIAWTGTRLFSDAIVDTNPPFWIDVRLDWVVLAFVTLIAVTAAMVSSLVPGWRLSRTDVNHAMKDEGRGTSSLRMGRFSRWLVVVEVTLSCALLVVSGLMVRSIVENSRFDVPFATEDVFYGGVRLDARTFPQPVDARIGRALVEERLAQVGGLRAVAIGSGYPGDGGSGPWDVEGRTFDSVDSRPQAEVIYGSPSYLDVLRVTPVLGRVFTSADTETSEAVAIVDESFARRHLPDGPIGRRIREGQYTQEGLVFDSSPWLTVVGVVPALNEPGPSGRETGIVFRPIAQTEARFFNVLAAAANGEPWSVAGPVRAALAGVGDGLPLSNPNSLAAIIWQQGWPARVFGGLFTAFGFAALFLASVGLYGVMAFGVRQRTQEIGVRLAMGADRGGVLRMILWQGMWRVTLAVIVGLAPGWLLAGQLTELLRNVSPTDPVVFAVTAVTLLGTGLLACLVPALRASAVNPIVALRAE